MRQEPQSIVGITAGSFDLLHAGHILYLEECRMNCDHLIVCLQTDPTIDREWKNKPIQSTFERFIQLRALECVDQIIPYDTEADFLVILQNFHYDKRFLGGDYAAESAEFTGKGVKPETHFFLDRSHPYSSTQLRERLTQSHEKTRNQIPACRED